MSTFDKCKKIVPNPDDYRIFIRFNNILEEEGKVYLKSEFKPVPISFNYKNKIGINQKLQKSFNIVKSMVITLDTESLLVTARYIVEVDVVSLLNPRTPGVIS